MLIDKAKFVKIKDDMGYLILSNKTVFIWPTDKMINSADVKNATAISHTTAETISDSRSNPRSTYYEMYVGVGSKNTVDNLGQKRVERLALDHLESFGVYHTKAKKISKRYSIGKTLPTDIEEISSSIKIMEASLPALKGEFLHFTGEEAYIASLKNMLKMMRKSRSSLSK